MENETNFQLYMLDLDMYEFLVYMYVALVFLCLFLLQPVSSSTKTGAIREAARAREVVLRIEKTSRNPESVISVGHGLE